MAGCQFALARRSARHPPGACSVGVLRARDDVALRSDQPAVVIGLADGNLDDGACLQVDPVEVGDDDVVVSNLLHVGELHRPGPVPDILQREAAEKAVPPVLDLRGSIFADDRAIDDSLSLKHPDHLLSTQVHHKDGELLVLVRAEFEVAGVFGLAQGDQDKILTGPFDVPDFHGAYVGDNDGLVVRARDEQLPLLPVLGDEGVAGARR